jgi:hypothetical protein
MSSEKNNKNTVLLIEPRIIDVLPTIVNEYRNHLGDQWNYVFYCGKGTVPHWQNNMPCFVELRELEVDNFPEARLYNDFMKQRELWESLYGDYVLTIQADTWILNIPPYDINYFINLNKSYIGGNMAYVWGELYRENIRFEHRNFNGGLSLRKRHDMILVIDVFPPEPTAAHGGLSSKMETDAEDCYYTIGCHRLGLPIGDTKECSHFAVTTLYRDAFFGIHQPSGEASDNLIRRHECLRGVNPHLKLEFPTLKVLYRYSDSKNNKHRPPYFSKEKCFESFVRIFNGHPIIVIADNVCEETYGYLSGIVGEKNVIRTALNNSKSFLYCVQVAIQNFADNDKIYLVEDDYLHKKEAPKILLEGLEIAHYASGYDHLDKYMNYSEGGANPYVEKGGEETRVILSRSRHWKYTNSCCMTFATTVKTLKEDFSVYAEHCVNLTPADFNMFIKLRGQGRKLISCIPAVSTHCETQWLSPFVEWSKEP